MANKEATSFRLTPEAIALIKELAKHLGVSQTDIIELAIRKLAQHENVQVQAVPRPEGTRKE